MSLSVRPQRLPQRDVCRVCGHALGLHPQNNDHHDCQLCNCERGCCFDERCPNSPYFNGLVIEGWGGNPGRPHICCICMTDD